MEMMELNEELSDECGPHRIDWKRTPSRGRIHHQNYNDERIREQELQKLKSLLLQEKYLKRILDRLADNVILQPGK